MSKNQKKGPQTNLQDDVDFDDSEKDTHEPVPKPDPEKELLVEMAELVLDLDIGRLRTVHGIRKKAIAWLKLADPERWETVYGRNANRKSAV